MLLELPQQDPLLEQRDINSYFSLGSYNDGSPSPEQQSCHECSPESPHLILTDISNLKEDAGAARSPVAAEPFPDSKLAKKQAQKRYLGVRVRMPVRDMLRKIRIAKGIDPNEMQDSPPKGSKSCSEIKKRVHQFSDRRHKQIKQPAKSLEELAMLVEVLAEDLARTRSDGNKAALRLTHNCTPQSTCSMFQQDHNASLDLPPESIAPSPQPSYISGDISPERQDFHHSPIYEEMLFQGPRFLGGNCNKAQEDTKVYSQVEFSPPYLDYQVPSIPDVFYPSAPSYFCTEKPQSQTCYEQMEKYKISSLHNVQDTAGLSFFQFQLRNEESLLRLYTDKELLEVNKNGSTSLHRAVFEGKRAKVYAIAQRMVKLNKIDTKDAEERTALHLAAEKNQHLMVSDLISLGANINEKDKFGKTPLHLCAENGYIRVLEMLKSAKNSGIPLEVEPSDHNGLTPLHCAVIALNITVKQMGKCKDQNDINFLALRKDRLFEGMECLLQMGANPFTREPLLDRTAVDFAEEDNNLELINFFQSHYSNSEALQSENYASRTMLDLLGYTDTLYGGCDIPGLPQVSILN
ncbi:IKBZ inhibitor, partial [Polypterus senegalus]